MDRFLTGSTLACLGGMTACPLLAWSQAGSDRIIGFDTESGKILAAVSAAVFVFLLLSILIKDGVGTAGICAFAWSALVMIWSAHLFWETEQIGIAKVGSGVFLAFVSALAAAACQGCLMIPQRDDEAASGATTLGIQSMTGTDAQIQRQEEENMSEPQEISVTTKNTVSLVLGIIATILGVLALLFGWVPFLGLLALPAAALGGILAILGILVACAKRFAGVALPLLGGVLCAVGVALPLASTGATSVVITETAGEVQREMDNQRKAADEEKRREEATKSDYIAQHLELYEVRARYTDSVLDGRVPGVFFKIRNRGDRSLDKVEVTVLFKDANGDVIAEEDYLPVLVSEYSLRDSKPLKPGYVWQLEKGKLYSAKSVPSEWKEGSVEAKITDIRFSGD